MQEVIFIEGTREGYHPDQIRETMTVGELIAYLCEFDEDAKVMIQNDNGYTFGSVSCETISLGSYDEDEVDLGTERW